MRISLGVWIVRWFKERKEWVGRSFICESEEDKVLF